MFSIFCCRMRRPRRRHDAGPQGQAERAIPWYVIDEPHSSPLHQSRKTLSMQRDPQTGSTLFKLPAEIRNIIYSMVMSRDSLLHILRVCHSHISHMKCNGISDCGSIRPCWQDHAAYLNRAPDHFLCLLQSCQRL